MDTPQELYDETLMEFIREVRSHDLASDEALPAMKALEVFSKCRPADPTPEPDPAPTTRWGRFKAGFGKAWDNETTRVVFKAGGALASVVVVTYTTIYKDHVVERQAMSQANQRNS